MVKMINFYVMVLTTIRKTLILNSFKKKFLKECNGKGVMQCKGSPEQVKAHWWDEMGVGE